MSAKPITVRGWVSGDAAAHDIQAALSTMDDLALDMRVHDNDPATLESAASIPADCLMIEGDFQDPTFLATAERLIGTEPGQTPVIIVSPQVDLAMVQAFGRIGAHAVLRQPVDPIQLASALEQIRNRTTDQGHPPADVPRGKVIAVIASCGGIGATTTAVQLADSLHSAGIAQDKNAKAPIILDFDLQFGDVALSLDLRPQQTLYAVLEADHRLTPDALADVVTRHESGIEVVAAPPHIVPLDAMTGEVAQRLIELASLRAPYVIVNMPHAWATWTGDALTKADRVLLLGQTTVSSVYRTRRIYDLLTDLSLDTLPIDLVAMRTDRASWDDKVKKEVERIFGHGFQHLVRADQKTARMARDLGKPARKISKRAPLARDIESYAQDLTRRWAN